MDDGKSTLVGRLLHDSKAILADQLEQVARTSAERGFAHGDFDFALLTDGLRAEREQGITIDVAYRYFSTGSRSRSSSPTAPGTCSTPATWSPARRPRTRSSCSIDGRKGVLEQTRRHLAVIALLRVPHVIVAVNKIDLLGFSRGGLSRRSPRQVRAVTAELGIEDVHVLPVSALEGDNIVERSERTPWYDGPALLELLESLPAQDELEQALEPFRLPVQLVLRPQGGLSPELAADASEVERLRDYRAVAGRVASGSVRIGDRVEVFPAGIATTVTGIQVAGTDVDEAAAPQSVSVQLADDVDAARGALVGGSGNAAPGRREVDVELFQLDARTLTAGSVCSSSTAPPPCRRSSRRSSRATTSTPSSTSPPRRCETNDIGRARLRLAADLPLEPYSANRHGGSFLVIHPSDGATLAAGIVRDLNRRARHHPPKCPPEGGEHVNTIRTATTITTLGLVAAMMAGCASAAGSTAPVDEVTELRLGYFANVTHAPALVGLEEGLFADALGDVEVTTQVFNAGPAAIEALSAGAIDATYIGPNPSINTFIQSGGESARIIAGAATGGAALVVRDGIDAPADLAGTTLATPQLGNTQDVALRSWLAGRGLRDRHLGRRRREHHADRERADAHAVPAGRPRRRVAAGAVGVAPDHRCGRARPRGRGRPVGGRRVPDDRAARARRLPRGAPRRRRGPARRVTSRPSSGSPTTPTRRRP